MNVEYFFSVPVVRVQNPEFGGSNGELTKKILEMEAAGDQYREVYRRDTQHGALFESQWDLFRRKEQCFRELAIFCHRALTTVVYRLSNFDDKAFIGLRWHYDAWFHVTRKGGYQGLHNHPNASWSGIYCVEPGGRSEDDFSGVLRLHDPRANANYYSDAANSRLRPLVNIGGIDVRHKAGQLVLFPSYLMHEIFPYSGDGPRIVIAFNASASQVK